MLELVKKFLANDKFRYLVAGGCTTFVNLIAFFVLRNFTSIDRNLCNVIAIAMAITFAYFANKFFVFRSKTDSVSKAIVEAVSFVGARLISMVVEVLGFAILCDSFRISEAVSKLMVQVVVLVLNYLFSKLFVFKKERRGIQSLLKDNFCYYFPFAIVMIFMLAIFIAEKIKPFGSNTITIVDSLHQYLPFFSDYRDKLLNEGSLFHTWNIAMGSNFMSLSAYYLSSPFNFLLLLVSKEHIVTMACFIIALKIALSAGTMSYYLCNKGGKRVQNGFAIAMGVAYALSNYVIGYSWNTMWMDCIMMFPLIILGFEKLMRDGNPKLYTLAMFYCLFCNYYIGFTICLFLVLWFFVYRHPGIKAFFVNGVRFAVYSLVSGGLAAFLLIPAYLGIMSTASASAELPKWEWYGSIFEMFKQQFFLVEPITNQVFDGGLNAYCGMFVLLALVLYVFTDRINLREKIGNILLLVFLMLSFNNGLLNFIWHGFHNQYGIPNRFSYIFNFILLVIAYDVLINVKHFRTYFIVSAVFFTEAFLLLVKAKTGNAITTTILVSSLAIVLVYGILCILRSRKILNKNIFQLVFMFICVIEIIVNAAFGFQEVGYANYDKNYHTTPQVTKAYDYVEELAETQDAGFYRAELMDATILDEATWHNMPSVGTFCSTVLGEMTTTMGRLGFYTGANEFLYMGSTPFTNSIFNVRYLLEREGNLNNFAFDYVDTVEEVGIYENPYPLSLGFCVDETIREWDRSMWRPMEGQEQLAMAMTGINGFFTSVRPKYTVSSDDCHITITKSGSISYTPNESGDMSFMVSFYIEDDGDYYVNCRGNSINKIRFIVDGQEIAYDRYQSQVFHLGELKAGQYVNVEYIYKNLGTSKKSAAIVLSFFNEERYKEVYDLLDDDMLMVEEYDDGYVYGTVNVKDNPILFTSIPYDEGWSLKVDGVETKYEVVCGSFIGVELSPGEHTIEFVYTPRGLYVGIIISLISCIILVLGVVNYSKKTDNNPVKNDDNEIDPNANI